MLTCIVPIATQLDHYCHWLGTPVGFGNRKLFILFCGYSAIFCAMGSAHSIYELTYSAPRRLGLAPLPCADAYAAYMIRTAHCGTKLKVGSSMMGADLWAHSRTPASPFPTFTKPP